MKRVLRLGLNDVRLTLKDRPAFFWLLVFPLLMMWFFGQFGGGGATATPKIALTLVDQDRGWLAREFVAQLEHESVSLRELEADEFATAEDKVRTLIIPEGFTAGVLAGKQQQLRFEADEGSNESFGVAGQVHVVRAIARTLGILAEMKQGGTLGGGEPAAVFERLAGRTPTVTLDVDYAGAGRPVPGGYRQSVPGILTMIVLMMTLIYGAVFLTLEKQTGMLRRQVHLPVGRLALYGGKFVGRMMIASLQIVILVLAGRFLFGVSWGNSPIGLLMVLASFAAAVAGLATLLGAVLSTAGQASAVGWILSMALAGIGGCWWPAEVMPEWLRAAAYATPTAWAMDGFHALISYGRGVEAVWLPSLVLCGFALLFAFAGARFLQFD